MTVDLLGGQGHIKFSNIGWSKILTIAQQYGWQPMGTKAPGPLPELEGESPSENNDWRDWDGNYLTNDFQSVTAEDATNIAAALERALVDIPDHDAYQDKRVVNEGPADTASTFERFSYEICTALNRELPGMEMRVNRDDRAVGLNTVMAHNTLEWFSGRGKQAVQQFIAFCKAGEFCIS